MLLPIVYACEFQTRERGRGKAMTKNRKEKEEKKKADHKKYTSYYGAFCMAGGGGSNCLWQWRQNGLRVTCHGQDDGVSETLLKPGVESSSHTCNAVIAARSTVRTPSASALCSRNQSGLVQLPLFLLTIRLLMHNNISWWQGGKEGKKAKAREGKGRGGMTPQPESHLLFGLHIRQWFLCLSWT